MWLDVLRADAAFGWRQLRKHVITSAAAILSVGLAIGACTAAFRLIDSLLLRPLPVAAPERLYTLEFEGVGAQGEKTRTDSCSYPMFRLMRSAVSGHAELLAITSADRIELTYASDQAMERAYRQYVSGWTFGAFGLRAALGRLLTEEDDRTPGAHPYAVISHDYWTRRFGRDPSVIGRTFHMGADQYEIVGVIEAAFTGTDPGTITDIFVPTMMMTNGAIGRSDYSWFRTWVRLEPGASAEPVGERLRAAFRAFQTGRTQALAGVPADTRSRLLSQRLVLAPAAAGVSDIQDAYRSALGALGVLVTLVLLIACANVSNLMSVQAAAQAREMALRVALGAGRWRLMQLVLVKSAWLGLLAAGIGSLFASWSAPLVVSLINPPDNPARLVLPADWRVLGFGVVVILGVTTLFGLAPALQAWSTTPNLKRTGAAGPHAVGRAMYALVAVQVAFCVLVLVLAGLFVATFERLSNQPTGFAAERLLNVETVATRGQPASAWEQVAEQLRHLPGVETVALTEWPAMAGGSWNGFVAVDGAPPDETRSQFLSVSAGWRDAMKIPLLEGRDVRGSDLPFAVALVNDAFAKHYFRGTSPVGRSFERIEDDGTRTRIQVVGMIGDARYLHLRKPVEPTAHFPFTATYRRATFIVRASSADPASLGSMIRRAVARARSDVRVTDIRTQMELNQANSVRERLLAVLASFFATVALALASVGLYGVIRHVVLQRRREIGVRIALGAGASDIARRVSTTVFSMMLVGALTGLAAGRAAGHYLDSLFYGVTANDPTMLAASVLAMFAVSALAALPPVLSAVRIDPMRTLRVD
jgi:predicted permease